MSSAELVCLKCGYRNQLHRSTCKNCGEALTAEAVTNQQIVAAKRKKPLIQWADWLRAIVGFVFLVPGLAFGVFSIIALVNLSLISLLLLIISVGLLYGSSILFSLPIYYRYLYKHGHEVTKGHVVGSLEEEHTDTDGNSRYIHYVFIHFVPDKSFDPRPRRLKCEAMPGTRMWSRTENEEILVYYALKNPDIMLFEGEENRKS